MPLLCERYTTSKLKEYKDLLKLNTFGFRGEALASIAQISTVTVVSKHRESDLGYQYVHHRKMCKVALFTTISLERYTKMEY